MRLRHGRIAPIQMLVLEKRGHAHRDMDERAGVRWPGFDQANFAGRIGRQPVGQHAAGGPGAHNDIVEFCIFRNGPLYLTGHRVSFAWRRTSTLPGNGRRRTAGHGGSIAVTARALSFELDDDHPVLLTVVYPAPGTFKRNREARRPVRHRPFAPTAAPIDSFEPHRLALPELAHGSHAKQRPSVRGNNQWLQVF